MAKKVTKISDKTKIRRLQTQLKLTNARVIAKERLAETWQNSFNAADTRSRALEAEVEALKNVEAGAVLEISQIVEAAGGICDGDEHPKDTVTGVSALIDSLKEKADEAKTRTTFLEGRIKAMLGMTDSDRTQELLDLDKPPVTGEAV